MLWYIQIVYNFILQYSLKSKDSPLNVPAMKTISMVFFSNSTFLYSILLKYIIIFIFTESSRCQENYVSFHFDFTKHIRKILQQMDRRILWALVEKLLYFSKTYTIIIIARKDIKSINLESVSDRRWFDFLLFFNLVRSHLSPAMDQLHAGESLRFLASDWLRNGSWARGSVPGGSATLSLPLTI